jgi:hypothetical protein
MLPFVIVPPSGVPPSTVIVNLSTPLPGSPLSWIFTVKLQGALFLVQLPEKLALLREMLKVVIETLCTFTLLAWF